MWMNEMEVEDAVQLLADNPVMGAAAKYLHRYMELVNENSDGWAYWRFGTKCADDLSQIVNDAAKVARGWNREPYIAPTSQTIVNAAAKITRFANTHAGLRSQGAQMPPFGNY